MELNIPIFLYQIWNITKGKVSVYCPDANDSAELALSNVQYKYLREFEAILKITVLEQFIPDGLVSLFKIIEVTNLLKISLLYKSALKGQVFVTLNACIFKLHELLIAHLIMVLLFFFTLIFLSLLSCVSRQEKKKI